MSAQGRFRVALLLALLAGWISLSHEILWVHVIIGAWRNSPMAFGTTLGSMLIGIAIGATTAPALQRRAGLSELRFCAACLGVAGLSFWVLPGMASVILLVAGDWGLLALHGSVALVAALMGGMLPILARYAVPDDANVGARVSVIYFANVIGSTIGPLFTGFFLLEWLSVDRAILAVGLAGLVAAAALALMELGEAKWQAVIVAAASAALMALGHAKLYDGFSERLHFRTAVPEERYVYQAHGRVGSLGVQANGRLFSDGLYDGGYNVNPSDRDNNILRAYFLPVLQPSPRRVLEIGLGSGSWTSVMSRYPDVQSLTVVEINPKYVDAMQTYPEIAAALKSPKVTLEIDDGRRWMRRHPTAVFDAIVINGTWHWRANATHLLSVEFLREVKSHLAPGGVTYFNTTGSQDVLRTAAEVFAHVIGVENFAAASDRVMEMSRERRVERLLQFPSGPGQGPLFERADQMRVMSGLLSHPMEDIGAELRSVPALRVITEDNMVSEFKSNWSGKWWNELPARAFAPERGWLEVLFP